MKRAVRVSSPLFALAVVTVALSAQQGAAPADRWTQFRGSSALLGTNRMNEPLMATPAISGNTLFIRTLSSLVAVR